ncbi:hypothetical protein HNY73_014154 [Argiope bruennichi]|uniref:Uncharacterized protein n=1 Tax=Argiope bruennichi TaxID=94029 RepID=A0A8T0ETB5_ARGBR|nr:hypothetical protein HNY73_014154 [Argiope bruennichi]
MIAVQRMASRIFRRISELGALNFTTKIQCTSKASIPRGRRKNKWVPYWRDHNINAMMQKRGTLCREFERDNRDENRRKPIEISHKIEEETATCKSEKWADFCSKLDPRMENYKCPQQSLPFTLKKLKLPQML